MTDEGAPARTASIPGVVPCAGASTRMGSAKALLPLGDRTFVDAVVGALRGGGCDPVIVVVSDDPAIAEAATATGATVLENPDPGEGPITSLRLALRAIPAGAPGVLFLPVDHPFVAPDTVARVLSASAGADLVVPTFDGERGHPAFLGRALFAELLDPELKGGARTVVHRHLPSATLLPVDDPGVLRDIDTPEELAHSASDAP